MFTSALLLMTLTKSTGNGNSSPACNVADRRIAFPRQASLGEGGRSRTDGPLQLSRQRDGRSPCLVQDPLYGERSSKRSKSTRTASEHFCGSLHAMHECDHAGLLLVKGSSSPNATTRNTTCATSVVTHSPTYELGTRTYDVGMTESAGEGVHAKLEDNGDGRSHGHRKNRSEYRVKQSTKIHPDKDHLAALLDEIAGKRARQKQIMDQVATLDRIRWRYERAIGQNRQRIDESRRRRSKLDTLAKSRVDLRWKEIVDLEAEKSDMDAKLERMDDAGTELAMRKEEKHRCLLEIIDNAPAVYHKESSQLEERHLREQTRFNVTFGLVIALSVAIIVLHTMKFGMTEN
ncbi:uncharacterized protein [Diadema setosum]|uniref:uncharacterized protein isoform X2 n=1 Tax=Diadema setosum TaxID=31175 RepID=UPI003B3B9677